MNAHNRSLALEKEYTQFVGGLMEEFCRLRPNADSDDAIHWIKTSQAAALMEWFQQHYADWAELVAQRWEAADIVRSLMAKRPNLTHWALTSDWCNWKAKAEAELIHMVTEDCHDLAHEVVEYCERTGALGYAELAKDREHEQQAAVLEHVRAMVARIC